MHLWKNEPAHEKTYNKTSATSEGLANQPAHHSYLIRVFADLMYLLKPRGYYKGNKREPLPYWMDVENDQSLWSVLSFAGSLMAPYSSKHRHFYPRKV